ncbi:Cyclin-T1-5 [Senna tora]|uniref:B-like cyclin n=1 Tax=Senna tora TaxID=362788 RepID=A0A835CCM7_9FABA|nr:Cyclin-T1-5 [Senna tora]
MAGFLPGDVSQNGAYPGSFRRNSEEMPEDGPGWYFTRKEIEENSPSKRDGIDWKRETYLRKSYCTFLQDLGMRLKVPQVTIATAIIFCHRFFLRHSLARNDRRTIATVCMFLAGKVEETPRPLKDVIIVSYEIINKKDPVAVQRIKQKEVYEQQKELILIGERVVLQTLGYDLNLHHPYKPLVEAIKKFKVAQNALAQVAWNFVNDGLRTSLCLQFQPHHIAAGAIFLAAKFLKVKLPSDGEKVWWQEFDVTPRQLEDEDGVGSVAHHSYNSSTNAGNTIDEGSGFIGSKYAGNRFSITPYITPRLTPQGTPKVISTAGSPKKTSGATSPRRLPYEGRQSLSSWYPSSQQSSAANSPPRSRSLSGRTPRIDGKEFFRQARSRLSYEQFSAFLANIKELNAQKQTREETLRKAEEIFGTDNKDLFLSFQGLLNRNVH